MQRSRVALAIAGVLLLAFGAFRLVTQLDPGDLVALALWMVVAVALHDLLVAPATVGVGVLLTRVPPRSRRYVQGALIVSALITVIAVPLIGRRGTQPAVKAILLRDYASNLALMIGLTLAVAIALYLLRVLRDSSSEAGPDDVEREPTV